MTYTTPYESDGALWEALKRGEDAAWRDVWFRALVPELKTARCARALKDFSLTDGDVFGTLYSDMVGRNKLALYRNDGGSLIGWLRRYIRGYVMQANPAPHGELSLEAMAEKDESKAPVEIPVEAGKKLRHNEIWNLTHLCFRELWNEGPRKAYILLLKTRFFLSSAEIARLFDISEVSVDQIYSRGSKFMREKWVTHEKSKQGAR